MSLAAANKKNVTIIGVKSRHIFNGMYLSKINALNDDGKTAFDNTLTNFGIWIDDDGRAVDLEGQQCTYFKKMLRVVPR